MPKGVYQHKPHASHATKKDIVDYIKFYFRDDIKTILDKAEKPELLAIELYKKETGKTISLPTAKKQRGRWVIKTIRNDETGLFKIIQKKNCEPRYDYVCPYDSSFNPTKSIASLSSITSLHPSSSSDYEYSDEISFYSTDSN